MSGKTLNNSYEFRDNSFNFIRLISALSVMFGHYFTYADKAFALYPEYSIVSFDKYVPTLAIWFSGLFRGVPIFFAMSAFLICASIERSKSAKEYFYKRFIRIYPELWMAIILNAVIVFAILGAPILKSLIVWIAIQSFGVAVTPHTFDTFATGSLNGAMWTIFVMIQSYVILFFIYRYLKKFKTIGWVLVIAICSGVNIALTYVHGPIVQLLSRTIIPYAIWFLMGVFLYVKRERAIPLLKKYFWVYTSIFILYFVINLIYPLHIPGYYCSIIHGILLPMITIGFAYKFKDINLKNDFSYELYLYHWIVLNVMVYYNIFSKLNWLVCVLIYATATFLIAIVSNRISKKIIKK